MQVLLLAKLNGHLVYRRTLKGYASSEGLELAISNAIRYTFNNYVVEVIR